MTTYQTQFTLLGIRHLSHPIVKYSSAENLYKWKNDFFTYRKKRHGVCQSKE